MVDSYIEQVVFSLLHYLITCNMHSLVHPNSHLSIPFLVYHCESFIHSVIHSVSQSVSQSFIDVSVYLVFVTRITGLRATYVTSKSVRVEWKPVPERFILGYKVLVQNTSFSHFVVWNLNSTLMEGLHSNTLYVITVFPVHGLATEGIPPDSSQSIIVTTEADRGKTWACKACNTGSYFCCESAKKHLELEEISGLSTFMMRVIQKF